MKKIKKYATIFGCIILILTFSFSFQKHADELVNRVGSMEHFASFMSHSAEYIVPNTERVHIQILTAGKLFVGNANLINPINNLRPLWSRQLPVGSGTYPSTTLSKICKLQI